MTVRSCEYARDQGGQGRVFIDNDARISASIPQTWRIVTSEAVGVHRMTQVMSLTAYARR